MRFTDEYTELADAAAQLAPTTVNAGYVGEAALAAARGVTTEGEPDTGRFTRAELAALQRELFAARTALARAAAWASAARRLSTSGLSMSIPRPGRIDARLWKASRRPRDGSGELRPESHRQRCEEAS